MPAILRRAHPYSWCSASALCALAMGLAAAGGFAVPTANAVEYVKTCPQAGEGYFFVPGTDTCINAVTGTTYDTNTQKYTQNRFDLAFQGTAIAMALPTPFIEPGKNFAIAGNVATYEGAQGLALGGALRAVDGLSFSGSVGVGLNKGSVGGRAGFNFSW